MIRLFTIITIFILFFNCKNNSNQDLIIDHFPDLPYSFNRPNLTMPDSLGGSSLTGKILTRIDFDSSGTILDYKVMYIKLKDTSGDIRVEYRSQENNLDKNALKYVKWVGEYIDRLVISKKSDLSEVYREEKYTILFPIHFPEVN